MALLSVSTVLAQAPLIEARDDYYQGVYGDKDAAAQADKLFANLHQQSPNDALVAAYFGSLRLLEAQRTWALWRKNALSKEGIQLLDSAVTARPADLEIRFVRAATERELPGFFGRKEQAKNDLALIVKTAEESVQTGTLQPRLAAASFFYYGLDWQKQLRAEEVRKAWQTAVRIAPDSHAGKLAAAKLKEALP